MKKTHLSKSLLATLFLGVYIFVAFFAPRLHQHSSGFLFKDFHFKKTEKSCKQNTAQNDFFDCLSCHLLHDGKAVLPLETTLPYLNPAHVKQAAIACIMRLSALERGTLQVRGPPSVFI